MKITLKKEYLDFVWYYTLYSYQLNNTRLKWTFNLQSNFTLLSLELWKLKLITAFRIRVWHKRTYVSVIKKVYEIDSENCFYKELIVPFNIAIMKKYDLLFNLLIFQYYYKFSELNHPDIISWRIKIKMAILVN